LLLRLLLGLLLLLLASFAAAAGGGNAGVAAAGLLEPARVLLLEGRCTTVVICPNLGRRLCW
jgi:hypothetical protein